MLSLHRSLKKKGPIEFVSLFMAQLSCRLLWHPSKEKKKTTWICRQVGWQLYCVSFFRQVCISCLVFFVFVAKWRQDDHILFKRSRQSLAGPFHFFFWEQTNKISCLAQYRDWSSIAFPFDNRIYRAMAIRCNVLFFIFYLSFFLVVFCPFSLLWSCCSSCSSADVASSTSRVNSKALMHRDSHSNE